MPASREWERMPRDPPSPRLSSSVGALTPRNDPDLAAGTVISADPVRGAEVAVGTVVNLVVASGLVTIVDYKGYTVDAARESWRRRTSPWWSTTGGSRLPRPRPRR